MQKCIASALLLASLTSCSSADPRPISPSPPIARDGPSVMDWRGCVRNQAALLAFAPGSDSEIADAALSACKDIESRYVDAMLTGGPGSAEIAMRAHPQLREDARQDAVGRVIELRAKAVRGKNNPAAPRANDTAI